MLYQNSWMRQPAIKAYLNVLKYKIKILQQNSIVESIRINRLVWHAKHNIFHLTWLQPQRHFILIFFMATSS